METEKEVNKNYVQFLHNRVVRYESIKNKLPEISEHEFNLLWEYQLDRLSRRF
jgi:hypothetical protein